MGFDHYSFIISLITFFLHILVFHIFQSYQFISPLYELRLFNDILFHMVMPYPY